MAAPKPKLPLPFDPNASSLALMLPNGTPFEGNNQQYFDACMGLMYETAAKLKPLADIEKKCREEVQKLLYPEGYPTNAETGRMDGVDKYELPGGWTLTFEKRVGAKIDETLLPGIREAVAALPVDPESGEIPTLGDAIRYRAELSDTNYGTLAPEVRVLLNEALTFTPGLPGVKIEAPKAKATSRPDQQKARGAE